MKKIFTLLFLLVFFFNALIAQQQIQNPGFEQWEDVGLPLEEPVDWSSIKTSDNLQLNGFAPVVWGQSTDAHSGNYSIYLFNDYNTLINDWATGTITNGRIHSEINTEDAYSFTDTNDERWHSVLTDRPDSVVGWFKCNPGDGDFGTVKVLLHTGYAQLPGVETNHIAIAYYELPGEEISEWTRFSVPFVYTSSENPEYYLAMLTSGNGLDAIGASTVLFDDLKFIYNPSDVDELSETKLEVTVVNGFLHFSIEENNKQKYELTLVDLNGRVVLNENIYSGENSSINVSNLESGLYIATAVNKDKKLVKKVLIN